MILLSALNVPSAIAKIVEHSSACEMPPLIAFPWIYWPKRLPPTSREWCHLKN